MLEVGNFAAGPSAYVESRTHFGAWCIVSSPLILGLDLTNAATVDTVWDIISNTEAIAVNQQWAGEPGRLVVSDPSYQVWSKRLPKDELAVLAFNRGGAPINITVPATLLAPTLRDNAPARDIWSHTDKAGVVVSGKLRVIQLASHDSVFYRFSLDQASTATAQQWHAALTTAATVSANPPVISGEAAALEACHRVQGGGAGMCATLTPCEQRCAAAGHCCVGTTSAYQHPSCAQGCLAAEATKTLQACEAICAAADNKCSWALNATQMSNCGSCPSTCCNAVVTGECKQGCSFAFE